MRPNHKAPWLRRLNEDEAHQARAARAAARKRKRKTKYLKTGNRHTHRRVAERVIGRPLTSDEIVHHIDEDSHNNDPANLAIGISRRYHQHIHAWLRRNGDRPKVFGLRKRQGRVRGLKYTFKTRPYRHQVKALKKLIFQRGGGLFMEMGTGKTKVAIDFACAMHLKTGVDRVVIVCPKSVMGVWKLEIKKHAPEKTRKTVRWIIINYDQLADRTVPHKDGKTETTYVGRMHVLKKFLGAGKSILIADESHLMKKPSAQRSKAMYTMGKEADHRLILTGTPLTKNVIDLYQQFKFLDERIFGTNKGEFERRYCVFGGYGNYKLLRYINLDDLKRKAKPHVFQVKKKDCLDLPARTDQVVPVRLTGEAKRLYMEMASDGLATIAGHEVEADLPITKVLRLQQIASGFLKVEGEVVQFGFDKARQLEGDLTQFQEQDITKGVIFAQFIPDLKLCAEIARKFGFKPILFHGDVSATDRELRLCEFDETDEPCMFVAQNDAGSMGISLTAASNAIHYSQTRKYATDVQTKGRLHRIGQHHPVNHRFYITPGVDQAIWIANRTKRNVADLVLTRPELLMQEGYEAR